MSEKDASKLRFRKLYHAGVGDECGVRQMTDEQFEKHMETCRRTNPAFQSWPKDPAPETKRD